MKKTHFYIGLIFILFVLGFYFLASTLQWIHEKREREHSTIDVDHGRFALIDSRSNRIH